MDRLLANHRGGNCSGVRPGGNLRQRRPDRDAGECHRDDGGGGGDQDLLLADPGARDMFDDRVYKGGALTLHTLRGRLGDEKFFALLKDWTSRHRHGTVGTDDFTGLAANYSDESLRPWWDAWLYSTEVP